MYLLSIIIPVYNEERTIVHILDLLQEASGLDAGTTQYIIVDDGSTDSTWQALQNSDYIHAPNYIFIRHQKNAGKGTAIRTAIPHAQGKYTIIQDADLEYTPRDIMSLLIYAQTHNASVVYGSRNLLPHNHRGGWFYYWGGRLLSIFANILYNQHLTDEATCYKLFQTDLLAQLPLACKRFEFCPEVTALVAKRGIKIPEIPIHYNARSKAEGKKINLRDGWKAVITLLKYRFKKTT